jgi:ElaB/YqjD/DUF883 family membrane-anchored ribosome-binding protein
MATTTDMAPTPRKSSGSGSASSRAQSAANSSSRERELEAQVEQLQADLKSITETVKKLTGAKAEEVKDIATAEFKHLKRRGQAMVDEAQDQFSDAEKQLKDTIREKPLTAVASAVGIGFVLALLVRH